MKLASVFRFFVLLLFFFLAGCSSFVQDIKTKSNIKDYTVSFFASGGEGEMNSIKVQYQQKIILPDCTFTAPDVSMDFAGWALDANETQVIYPEDGEIEVTEDMSLYAMWMDKDLTRYKVIHLFQNIDDDGYTEDTKLTQNLSGYDGAYTDAKALPVYGFTADPFDQLLIEKDSESVQEIRITYKRNTYTIYFAHNGECTGEMNSEQARYQQIIPLSDCTFKNPDTSMKFAGWSFLEESNDQISYINDEEIEVTRDMTLYAQWEKKNETSLYKVIHSFQNIDGTGYTEEPHLHQLFEGHDGSPTAAKPLKVTGFNAVTPIIQKPIEDDEAEGLKTIVEIKYNRKDFILTFDLAGGTMTSPGLSDDNKLVLKYGTEVPVPAIEKEGYIFTGWTPALPAKAVVDTEAKPEIQTEDEAKAEASIIDGGHYTANWEKSYSYIPGTDGGLVGTPTVEQGSVAKSSIMELKNTEDLYIVPKGTVARINTDGSFIWDPEGLGNEEIHVHGAFHYGRKIELSPYIISKYPVTTQLYIKVMGKDPSDKTKIPMEPYEYNPVNNITWYDAVIFCNKLSIIEGLEPVFYYINEHGRKVTDPKLWAAADYPKIRGDYKKNGYRLPTNAEWEFAARGGDPSSENWHNAFSGADLVEGAKVSKDYEEDANLSTVAYYKFNTNQKGPCTVGQKKSNRLGLHDMSGGICEWTYDFINSDFSLDDRPYLVDDIVVDPMGTEKGTLHSLRGGSYFSSAFYCTVTYILSGAATTKKFSYGLRLCRNAE